MKLNRTTKTIGILLAFALLTLVIVSRPNSGSVVVAAGQPGSPDGHAAPAAVDPNASGPTLVYECFDLQSQKDPNAFVRLTTKNFGNDTVNVRKALRMCEPAIKTKTDITTGTGVSVAVYPNAQMTLRLKDPGGNIHDVMLWGTTSMRMSPAPNDAGFFDTEMLQLNLQGNGPISPKPVAAAQSNSFFDVFFDISLMLDPAKPDPLRKAHEGFFDIFTEISLDSNSSLEVREAALNHASPLRFVDDGQGNHVAQPASPIQLTVRGNPTGFSIVGAVLTPEPAPNPQGVTRVLECFKVDKGLDPNDPYILDTKNFTPDRVIVNTATHMCEGALKSSTPVDAASALKPAPVIWECFGVANGDAQGAALFFLTTRNFGTERIAVRKTAWLCEEARKVPYDAAGNPIANKAIGQPTGSVYQCFTIVARDRAVGRWFFTQNFGPDPQTVVRKASQMCEPARKTPSGDFPPFDGPPTGATAD